MPIWSNEYLTQLETDGLASVVQDVNCLFHKFYLASTAGRSVLTLPEKVRGILRITWRGIQLDPISWDDTRFIHYASAIVDYTAADNFIEAPQGRPSFYALHPTNIHSIRLYPTPNETFGTTGDPYSQEVDEARLCISCWRNTEQGIPSALPPVYITRRTVKAYMLWKAFGKDGRGQNLTASKFYKAKYDFLISQFRKINEGTFLAKRYKLGDGSSRLPSFRLPRPTLPPNFEQIIY